uniref:Uncharacterized protein n=1 Tax=Arundo donax TaxID=35708 RepID=A0A0A9HWB8_ARUDO
MGFRLRSDRRRRGCAESREPGSAGTGTAGGVGAGAGLVCALERGVRGGGRRRRSYH